MWCDSSHSNSKAGTPQGSAQPRRVPSHALQYTPTFLHHTPCTPHTTAKSVSCRSHVQDRHRGTTHHNTPPTPDRIPHHVHTTLHEQYYTGMHHTALYDKGILYYTYDTTKLYYSSAYTYSCVLTLLHKCVLGNTQAAHTCTVLHRQHTTHTCTVLHMQHHTHMHCTAHAAPHTCTVLHRQHTTHKHCTAHATPHTHTSTVLHMQHTTHMHCTAHAVHHTHAQYCTDSTPHTCTILHMQHTTHMHCTAHTCTILHMQHTTYTCTVPYTHPQCPLVRLLLPCQAQGDVF